MTSEEWEYADCIWNAKYHESDTGFGRAGVDPLWYANCQTEQEYGFVKRFGEYEITDPDRFRRAFMRQGHDEV